MRLCRERVLRGDRLGRAEQHVQHAQQSLRHAPQGEWRCADRLWVMRVRRGLRGGGFHGVGAMIRPVWEGADRFLAYRNVGEGLLVVSFSPLLA